VNDPLRFAGFRLHQSSFSADGAALRVVDRRSGRTIYHETLLLAGAVPAPIVDIRDGGASRYRGVIATGAVPFPTASAERLSFTLTGSGRSNDATVEPRNRDAWTLLVSDRAGRTGPSHRLGIGQSAGIADLTVEFVGVQTMPALRLPELPGFPDGALLRMAPDGVDPGRSALVIAGSGGPARVLRAGVPSNVAGDLEYTFDGPRGVSGITVRRDPGTWLVWTAVAMLIGGLAITFYVPSRRLWVRLSDGRAAFAGQAGMTGDFPAEVKQIHADAERRRPVDR
jgi:hypothetical protein